MTDRRDVELAFFLSNMLYYPTQIPTVGDCMQKNDRIPDAVVRRLPGYYRNLRELEAEGVTRLSSRALGERMGLTASQIRQDINCFGGFGQQGYGYNVSNLKRNIGQILGLDAPHHVVIVGAGNIGCAVAEYPSFRNEGFRVEALFDSDPDRIGKTVQGAPILAVDTLAEYLKTHPVDILVLSTPSGSAQAVLDIAVRGGVRAIWNFAPVELSIPEAMELANVHLSDSLMALSFRLHEREVRRQENPTWIQDDSQ